MSLFSALFAKFPYNLVLDMQCVLIILLYSALYAKCLIMYCFTCKVSYYLVLYMQSVLLLSSALYAKVLLRARSAVRGRAGSSPVARSGCGMHRARGWRRPRHTSPSGSIHIHPQKHSVLQRSGNSKHGSITWWYSNKTGF